MLKDLAQQIENVEKALNELRIQMETERQSREHSTGAEIAITVHLCEASKSLSLAAYIARGGKIL